MEMKPLSASVSRIFNPFDRREHDLIPVPTGQTIALTLGDLLDDGLVVSLNGHVISRADCETIVLADGDFVTLVPEVGDGDTLRLAAIAAISIAAGPAASWMTGGAFSAAGAAAMGWGGMALAAGLTMAGSMLVNALLPPPSPNLGGAGTATSQAYSWSPATTQQSGLPVVRCYGEFLLHGNIIVSSIENGDAGKQYANVLLDFGQGPYEALNDFRINDQPYTAYQNVDIESRLGNINQLPIGYFDDTRIQNSVGVKVVKGNPYIYTVPNGDYDGIEVELTAPNGLWYANNSGGLSSVSVDLRVEYSSDGGMSWVPVNYASVIGKGGSISYWSRGYTIYDEDGSAAWVEVDQGSGNKSDHSVGQSAGKYSLSTGRSVSTTWKWITEKVKVATTLTRDYVTLTGATQQPVRQTVVIDGLIRGMTYKIRVTNLSDDKTTTRYGDDIYLSSVTKVLKDDFQYPRTVLMGVRALATDQLSGSMNFSVLAKGAKVRVWNGSSWAFQWSANPAWVCWDILTQPVLDDAGTVIRFDGIDPSRLILSDFYNWAQWCDQLVPDGNGGQEVRCRFDGVFDTESNMWDAALQVCQSARAVLIYAGVKISVTFDHERTIPAQLFTVGNTIEDHFTETFLPMADRANEMEIDFVNAQTGHQRDKINVVDTLAQQSQPAKASVSLIGITRPSQAWREALYRLNRNRLLTRTIEIGADIDAIACRVGDLILVQHDVPMWGEGGRIVSGTASQVVLDKQVTLLPGKTYEITIRFLDDVIATRTISTSNTTTDTITLASALPETPSQYDVYSVGELTKSTKPFVVTSLSRDGDHRMTISAIEYSASAYQSDFTLYPAIDSQGVSTVEVMISGLSCELNASLTNDGTLNAEIKLIWLVDHPEYLKNYSVLVHRQGMGWSTAGSGLNSQQFVMPQAFDGATYTFKVLGFDYHGNQICESDALDYTVDSGHVAQIPLLAGISVGATSSQILFQCDMPSSPAFDGIEVHLSTQPSFTPSANTLAFKGLNTQCVLFKMPDKSALPAGTDIYLIAAGYSRVSKEPINYSSQITVYIPTSDTSAILSLSASSQVFQVKKDGSNNPASITVSAVLSGALSGNVTFTTSPSVTLTGTGNSRSLTYANFGNNDTVFITASLTQGGTVYSDSVTVIKVREGADGVVALLTNESQALPADSNGNILSYAGASTQMKVYIGSTDSTSLFTFSKFDSSGVSSSISGNTITVSSLTADAAYIDITAVKSGYPSITKRMSLTRVKAGENGMNGTPGMRGVLMVTSYGVGSSYAAEAAFSAQYPYWTYGRILGDGVTFVDSYNGNSTWYRSSDGSTNWIQVQQYVNGNMIVTGTFTAPKVYVDDGYTSIIIGKQGDVSQDTSVDGIKISSTRPSSAYGLLNLSLTSGASVYAANINGGSAVKGLRVTTTSGTCVNASNSTSGNYAFYSSSGKYGPFTGGHDALIKKGEWISNGDIVVDEYLVASSGWSDGITRVSISSIPMQKGVIGIQSYRVGPLDFADELPAALRDIGDIDISEFVLISTNSVGEGLINVCGEGGDFEVGDLICTSSIPGKGMRQPDDIVRSFTVAKIRESVRFDSPDQIKKVACVYMCG